MLILKNSIIVLLVLVPFISWAYDNFFFEQYNVALKQVSKIVDVATFPYELAKLSSLSPDRNLIMPVKGVSISQVEDSWGAPRSGERKHQGIDIFAKRGTPVYAVAPGFVWRTGVGGRGGNYIYTIGAGGRRYYYAHLDHFAQGIKFGTPVTTDTIIGYVGNTGNASHTSPHLHLGMYMSSQGARNPYNLLVNRI